MKNRLSFLLDIILLVLVAGVAGMGFLMKWVLPRGSGSLQVLGMTRHEWGAVHLWLSIALLVLLVLHIWLAWPQLVCRFRLWVKQAFVRWALSAGLLVLLLGLLSWPFAVKPTAPQEIKGGPVQENSGRQFRGGH